MLRASSLLPKVARTTEMDSSCWPIEIRSEVDHRGPDGFGGLRNLKPVFRCAVTAFRCRDLHFSIERIHGGVR